MLMIAEELDKLLMGECIFDLRQQGGPDFITIEREEDSKELTFEIAKQFQKWLKEKQETTDDEIFRMVVTFVLMVDDY